MILATLQEEICHAPVQLIAIFRPWSYAFFNGVKVLSSSYKSGTNSLPAYAAPKPTAPAAQGQA